MWVRMRMIIFCATNDCLNYYAENICEYHWWSIYGTRDQ